MKTKQAKGGKKNRKQGRNGRAPTAKQQAARTAANKNARKLRSSIERAAAEARHADNRREAELAAILWRQRNYTVALDAAQRIRDARTLTPRELFLKEMHGLITPRP